MLQVAGFLHTLIPVKYEYGAGYCEPARIAFALVDARL